VSPSAGAGGFRLRAGHDEKRAASAWFDMKEAANGQPFRLWHFHNRS
jgi:hypothetical protein